MFFDSIKYQIRHVISDLFLCFLGYIGMRLLCEKHREMLRANVIFSCNERKKCLV